MTQPFILSMAIQERANNGKYTGTHWRNEFKKYLKTNTGKIWYKEIILNKDRDYINIMLKEIKKSTRRTDLEKVLLYDLEALKDNFIFRNQVQFYYHFDLLKGNLMDYFNKRRTK